VFKKIDSKDGEFPPFVYELPEESRSAIQMDNNAHWYPTSRLFACGDVRCNENPLLLSLQILFLREHNRVARLLAKKHHDWDDDKLFSHARKYVIATIQHVTFSEFLYWLLARPFPEPDLDYDDKIDPRIHVFFSTVAFRYGHSEVSDLINIYSGKGSGPKLSDHYFDPYFLLDVGVNSLWEGMAYQLQQSPDEKFADSIRNHLFDGHNHYHYDLMSFDIQRARDHGIPSCNHARIAYGLHPIEDWEYFDFLDKANGANEKEVESEVSHVYKNPWVADAFICGLAEKWVDSKYAEKHHDYSNLGKLFEAAIISQFQRLRIGDRFWYTRHIETVCSHGDLEDVRHRTLADVIRDNAVEKIDLPDYIFRVNYSTEY